jgi:hypothetical protein
MSSKPMLIDRVLKRFGLVRYSLYVKCRDGLSAANCFMSEDDEQLESGRFAVGQLDCATQLVDTELKTPYVRLVLVILVVAAAPFFLKWLWLP